MTTRGPGALEVPRWRTALAVVGALGLAGCGGWSPGGDGPLPLAGNEVQRQGPLVPTGVATDLALDGPGFFVLQAGPGPLFGHAYTRLGQFAVDREGLLVALDGQRVVGWGADAAGALAATAGPLKVAAASVAPRATARATLVANLQADAALLADPVTGRLLPFDPANPSATSGFSTSLTVYDALGEAHGVQLFFHKAGPGTWDWHAMSDGAGLQGGSRGELTPIGEGALVFDVQGRLAAETQAWRFHPAGGTEPQPMALGLGDPTSAGGSGLRGVTQFASPSASSFVAQDGHAAGQLASLEVQADGVILGVFTNGLYRALGQVAVATFAAPAFLAVLHGQRLAATDASGPAVLGPAGDGLRGPVRAGVLEALPGGSSTCAPPGP